MNPKRSSKMFNNIPPDVNRRIGSFLDYDSRINFSRVLPSNDDKFVKKLESDDHNRYTKCRQLLNSIKTINRFYSARKRTIRITRMLRWMALTKDTCVLDIASTDFRQVLFDKAIEYSNENHEAFHLIHPKVSKPLVKTATLLLDRLSSHNPRKLFMTTGKLVEII